MGYRLGITVIIGGCSEPRWHVAGVAGYRRLLPESDVETPGVSRGATLSRVSIHGPDRPRSHLCNCRTIPPHAHTTFFTFPTHRSNTTTGHRPSCHLGIPCLPSQQQEQPSHTPPMLGKARSISRLNQPGDTTRPHHLDQPFVNGPRVCVRTHCPYF